MLIKIITFSFKKMRSKVSSGKRWPSCLGLNVLKCKIHVHLAITLKNVNLLCHRSADGSWPQFRRRELLWCLNQWTYTSSSLTSKVILRAARERPVGQGETACCSMSMRAISVIWVMSPIWSATVLFAQRLNQDDTKDIIPATCNRILHYNYKNNYK